MKNESACKSMPSQVILGVGVIALGVLFLLDNLGFLEFRDAIRFWPVILVLWGGVKLFDANTPHERLTFGLIFGFGVILTLNRMGLGFFNLRTLWPVILIAVGAAVVYKAVAGKRMIGTVSKTDEYADSVVDITAILGGFDRRLTTPAFRGGEITAIMGGCVLDLRDSSIEGDAVINVFAVMGGITIKCPPDWTIVLQGSPIMGAFDEKTITPPNNLKRLIVRGYAIMGGVEIRN